ncbi:hypothetical protein C3942_18075 [Solimonas fluminis]|uniref:Uncharacterized protein n=1 Tax=Solimonas fluminis TaxID=2086571 RepID=A0A2S5TBY7_9GAMM|nr:hypothetical protein [Solimonas fluminis]PPE72452.1 hypothetical protein C3942_18075 [Solimonas fluminis]
MPRKSETIVLREGDSATPSAAVLQDETHCMHAHFDADRHCINLDFSSREALRDFALALLQEASFGTSGQMEFYPLRMPGRKEMVVNGVRLTEGSSRLFVFYDERRITAQTRGPAP